MKLSTLLAVAGGCGIGVGTAAVLLRRERNEQAAGSSFLKRALKIAQEEETVRNLLGDNIKASQVKLENNLVGGNRNSVKVSVALRGDKDNAYVYAYARRNEEKEKFRLWKIEMIFEKIKNKKMILLELPEGQTLEDEVPVEPKPQRPLAPQRTGPMPRGTDLKREKQKLEAQQQLGQPERH